MTKTDEKAVEIRVWLKTKFHPDKAGHLDCLGRMLLCLFSRQTEDEKVSETTKHRNSKGFNGTDARVGTSMARQYKQRKTLSPNQWKIALKIMPKYARQIAEDWVLKNHK